MFPLFILIKPRSRKLKSILFLLSIICVQLIFISIHKTTSQKFKQIPIIYSLDSTPNADSMHYDHLVDVFQHTDFIHKPFEQKSLLYFDSLYKYNQDWQISSLNNLKYYKRLSTQQDIKKYYTNECEKEWQKLDVTDSKERERICNVVKSTILSNHKQNKLIENKIFNFIGHLKIFNQLYILRQLPYPLEFQDFENKLFPMFTGQLPIYKNYKDEFFQNFIPNVDNEENHYESTYYTKSNLIKYLVTNYQGRGIVFTTTDRQVKDLCKALKVLRFLQNELPIQIIYKGPQELSIDSQNLILDVARGDDDGEFKQKIWFVDVSPCIKEEFNDKLSGYAMKFLLTIFNSFNEMIFLDNDLIPFINPAQFFQLSNYLNTKTLFFKDRDFKNKGLSQQVLDFYKKLLPSPQFDSKFFEISPVQEDTILRNNFFRGVSKHFIDSGLFVMEKKTHVGGVLISLHLANWTPTSLFIYGDKELFWLGQLMVGNQVSFSKHFASSSGKLQIVNDRTMICSSKLTHLSNDDKIIWINGGLNYCNVDQVNQQDLNLSQYKGKFDNLQNLQKFYNKKFEIDSVIIPSSNLEEFPNTDGQPVKNWEFEPSLGCNNRFFCAFDKFGPLNSQIESQLITFDELDRDLYNQISSVWSN